ncbi:hypothetical protein MPNT_260010 [Candidatus Methylacidithermus pantelleriae]|uniref:Uncharacterized protein n=1 Tax=Candidatus Methylacidithermus pantelleriae TaxID=2744239 RepID=A0A8J2FSR7_9BACT|nr:hypothetical protein MPNT_260010 [Candidatus Methylacidithermus pantelleriae]
METRTRKDRVSSVHLIHFSFHVYYLAMVDGASPAVTTKEFLPHKAGSWGASARTCGKEWLTTPPLVRRAR